MEDDNAWRERLTAAIQASGKTMRAISLEAGMGAGYVHSILTKKDPKDPTVPNLIKVCDVLGVTLYRILYGFDLTPENQEILRLWAASDQEDQKALSRLLRRNTSQTPE